MDANELFVRVALPYNATKEHKERMREYARANLAHKLIDFLDEQRAKISIEIKEETLKQPTEYGFSGYDDVYQIWVEVISLDVQRVVVTNSAVLNYEPETKTIFGKIDDYLRKVSAARKYYWEM